MYGAFVIHDSVLELIGGTPMVRLRRIAGESSGMADVVVKLEGQNPAGSVKDRACIAMIARRSTGASSGMHRISR